MVPVLLKFALATDMKNFTHLAHAQLRRALINSGGESARTTLLSLVGQFDELQRHLEGKDKGQKWAAAGTLACLVHALGAQDQGLGMKIGPQLLRAEGEPLMQGMGASVVAAQSSATWRAPELHEVLQGALACKDPVGARQVLALVGRRLREQSASGAAALDWMIQNHATAINLRDPLAKVYFVKLCGASGSPAALQAVAGLADDVNFRVVLECIEVLTKCNSWTQLKALRSPSIVPALVASVVAAFQCPRPVLHFSALRATLMLAKCWAREVLSLGAGEPHPLNQLLTLTTVHLQNDSVYHRWRALLAFVWLAPPNNAPTAICERVLKELRAREMSPDMVVSVFGEILLRCELSPAEASADWSMLLVMASKIWRTHAQETLDAQVVLAYWKCALSFDRCSVNELLGDIVTCASGSWSATRTVLVERIERNAVYVLGKHFARFVAGSESAAHTILFILKRFALTGALETSLLAIECLGGASLHVSPEVRASIGQFLGAHFGPDSPCFVAAQGQRSICDCQDPQEAAAMASAYLCTAGPAQMWDM